VPKFGLGRVGDRPRLSLGRDENRPRLGFSSYLDAFSEAQLSSFSRLGEWALAFIVLF
jgi:hypothetical protein